jgi:CheY-like chemotaxis protein
MRLLLTESDPFVRQWLGSRADELGIQMIFAKDSGEAFEAINAETPDCVVLDASTSADESTPLWDQLRRDPSTHDIPVLLYSSSARWQHVAELAADEVDEYLPRPFTSEALLDAALRISRVDRPAA